MHRDVLEIIRRLALEATEHVAISFDLVTTRLFAPAQQATLDELSQEGGDDRYVHGGISLYEMLPPVVLTT